MDGGRQGVAHRVADHGGNWLESRMCHLGGQFAGILRVEVAQARRDELVNALRTLLFRSEPWEGRVHAKPMTDATPSPSPARR